MTATDHWLLDPDIHATDGHVLDLEAEFTRLGDARETGATMDDPLMDYETLTGTRPQARIDAENLDLLALFHYILGAITIVFSSIFIVHIVMGVMMARNPSAFFPAPSTYPPASAHSHSPGVAPTSVPTALGFPPEMGYLFATMGTIFVLGGWTLGGLTIYTGRCLRRRTNYVFIQVVAGLNCAFVQGLGTALGVFTFIVLYRPTVRALFGRRGEPLNGKSEPNR